jgi:hypothetical protein
MCRFEDLKIIIQLIEIFISSSFMAFANYYVVLVQDHFPANLISSVLNF